MIGNHHPRKKVRFRLLLLSGGPWGPPNPPNPVTTRGEKLLPAIQSPKKPRGRFIPFQAAITKPAAVSAASAIFVKSSTGLTSTPSGVETITATPRVRTLPPPPPPPPPPRLFLPSGSAATPRPEPMPKPATESTSAVGRSNESP